MSIGRRHLGRNRRTRTQGIHRRRPFTLHVETLEDRRVMNADDPLAGGLGGNQPADTVQAPAAATTAADNGLGTFASRDELRQWLIEQADLQYGDLFGKQQPRWGGWFWGDVVLNADLAVPRITSFAATSTGTTNVQVAGVDEADLVETDGEFLYIISGQDLVIVRAGEGDELEIMSRVRLNQKITGMYLDGDRLALVSTAGDDYAYGGGIIRPMILRLSDIAALDDGTGGRYRPQKPTTTVTLLDVSDRTAPTLVKRTEFDGRLIASRTVDGQLRLVISHAFSLPSPNMHPIEGSSDAEIARQPFTPVPIDTNLVTTGLWLGDYAYPISTNYEYESRDEYIERVIDAMLNDLPRVRDISLEGEVLSAAMLVTPEGIHRPDRGEFQSLTTVATIDMHGSGRAVDTASVMTQEPPTVYATEDSLYLLSTTWGWNFRGTDSFEGHKTNIWKFDFDAETHDVDLAARGRVDGTILNQFAVDEHDGRLRVVTTNHLSGNDQRLQVLEQASGNLNVVGTVGGLGAGEALYSVRFVGNVAFAVTFRQIDPLYVIDLSEPTAPEVVGELKVPGYSDYLQMLDDGRILAIGRAADEQTGLFEELQVSIFDVSDLSNPLLAERYSFGGGRTTTTQVTGDRWTRGDGDHHAVSYFAGAGLVAVPVFTADESWWNDGVEPLFEPGEGGLQVFRIDASGDLVPVALIEHEDLIHRSVVVGDRLFALSDGKITAHSLADPTVQIGELELDATESELTPLQRGTAPEAAAELAPALDWQPIDELLADPAAAAMGPAARVWSIDEYAEAALIGPAALSEADWAATALPAAAEEAPSAALIEDSAPMALMAAMSVEPAALVMETATVAAADEVVVPATSGNDGDGALGWLALSEVNGRSTRASRSWLSGGERAVAESAASPARTVQLAASVTQQADVDVLSIDAAFGDDAASAIAAWDEAFGQPGIGPLLA